MKRRSNYLSQIGQAIRSIFSSETLECERSAPPDPSTVSMIHMVLSGETLDTEREAIDGEKAETPTLFNLLFKPEQLEEWPMESQHSFSAFGWLFSSETLDDSNLNHSGSDRRG